MLKAVILLLAFFSDLWANCVASSYSVVVRTSSDYSFSCHWGLGCTGQTCADLPYCASCPSSYDTLGKHLAGLVKNGHISSDNCTGGTNIYCGSVYPTYGEKVCGYAYQCGSSTEADSMSCYLAGGYWNGTTCGEKQDTSYACADNWFGNVATGYQGHIVLRLIDGVQDTVESSPGTCAQMGYCSYGVDFCVDTTGTRWGQNISGSSSSSAGWDRSSSSVSCEQTAQYGNTCYFKCTNGAVGSCEGDDGNCDVVSNCSWKFSSSSGGSSSASGGSSSDAGGSSTSSGTGIDYTGLLEEIKDTIHNGNVDQLGGNALLAQISNQIGNIQTNVSINMSSGNYGNTLDSVNNALYGELPDTSTGIVDTSVSWFSSFYGDSLLAAVRFDDTTFMGTNGDFGINSDSLASTATAYASELKDIVDTGAVKGVTDSLARWYSLFNFNSLQGSSTGCPAFLTAEHSFNIGKIPVTFGGVGGVLCSAVLGEVTPWDIGRLALRFVVVFLCFIYLYKVCTGAKGDSDDD